MKIKKDIIEKMFAQAKQGLPNEVCGFLAGEKGEVTKHYELTNVDASPEHFTMDPKEQFVAVKDIRNEGLTLMACYHSHPETPARPSDEDIRLAYDPNLSYVIMSLKDGQKNVKSFRIQDMNVEHEKLEVTE